MHNFCHELYASGLVAFKLILRGHKLCSIIFLHLFHIHIHSRNNTWVLTHFPEMEQLGDQRILSHRRQRTLCTD